MSKGALINAPEPGIFSAPNWGSETWTVHYPEAFVEGERYATVSGVLTPPFPKAPTQPFTNRKHAAHGRRCAAWLVEATTSCPRPDLVRLGPMDPKNLSASDSNDIELRLFDDYDANLR